MTILENRIAVKIAELEASIKHAKRQIWNLRDELFATEINCPQAIGTIDSLKEKIEVNYRILYRDANIQDTLRKLLNG